MDSKELEDLINLSREPFKCTYKECSEYENYNQCFNHSHVLCHKFEEYYEKNKYKKNLD